MTCKNKSTKLQHFVYLQFRMIILTRFIPKFNIDEVSKVYIIHKDLWQWWLSKIKHSCPDGHSCFLFVTPLLAQSLLFFQWIILHESTGSNNRFPLLETRGSWRSVHWMNKRLWGVCSQAWRVNWRVHWRVHLKINFFRTCLPTYQMKEHYKLNLKKEINCYFEHLHLYRNTMKIKSKLSQNQQGSHVALCRALFGYLECAKVSKCPNIKASGCVM